MSAISSEDSAVLRTPIIDSELQVLLQRIAEEGGYAFASMAARAGAGDGCAAEAARELAWEQLHSGPWHSVVPVWRDAYAMACLYAAKHHYAAGEFRPALRALDMGLIMGGFTLREDLNLCIGKVIASLRKKENSNNASGVRNDEVYDLDFHLAEVIKSLPLKSLTCKTIGNKSGLSLEAFLMEHFASGSPVIISDSMNHWPAIERWGDMSYLKRVAGFRTIPVEVGKNYLSQIGSKS